MNSFPRHFKDQLRVYDAIDQRCVLFVVHHHSVSDICDLTVQIQTVMLSQRTVLSKPHERLYNASLAGLFCRLSRLSHLEPFCSERVRAAVHPRIHVFTSFILYVVERSRLIPWQAAIDLTSFQLTGRMPRDDINTLRRRSLGAYVAYPSYTTTHRYSSASPDYVARQAAPRTWPRARTATTWKWESPTHANVDVALISFRLARSYHEAYAPHVVHSSPSLSLQPPPQSRSSHTKLHPFSQHSISANSYHGFRRRKRRSFYH